MKRKLFLMLGGLVLSSFIYAQKAESPIKVFLKLDDYDYPRHPVKCNISTEVLDYLCEKDVKAGLGIIAGHLNDSSTAVLLPYLKKKAKDKTALFEFWHHGLYHEKFPTLTYEEQKSRFEKADSIVRKRFGIQMQAFGAPYNYSDSTTARVVTENPNYKVLIYVNAPVPSGSKILRMNFRVDMERSAGNPEFDFFVENYNKAMAKSMKIIALQGHPNGYIKIPAKMEEFKKIIQFLIEQKVQFITPYEYYLESKK